MDVDKSGTLDEGEVELLCATAGKRLTKRQLHDAMVSMDEDGSVRSFPTFSNVSTFNFFLIFLFSPFWSRTHTRSGSALAIMILDIH